MNYGSNLISCIKTIYQVIWVKTWLKRIFNQKGQTWNFENSLKGHIGFYCLSKGFDLG
jgi:hypothetical protein